MIIMMTIYYSRMTSELLSLQQLRRRKKSYASKKLLIACSAIFVIIIPATVLEVVLLFVVVLLFLLPQVTVLLLHWYPRLSPCMSVVKTQSERWKGCASETSVIHSHFMLTFAWCFSIASISGPSSKQKQTFASLLYKRLTWRTPNSSVGDAHNSFKFASLKGTL
jgi:hypothetical protein